MLELVRKYAWTAEKREYIKKVEPSRLLGDMTSEEIIEYLRSRRSMKLGFARNPELLVKEYASVDAGMSFIATGLKSASP